MNKPSGYVSATFDKRLPVVTDLLDEYTLRFQPFPAGRLDIGTEVMGILTNDGDLTERMLHPSQEVETCVTGFCHPKAIYTKNILCCQKKALLPLTRRCLNRA